MPPAFSARWQAVGFSALLILLFSLPWLTAVLGVKDDRRDAYSDVPLRAEPFRWVQSQIFSEHRDIDLAFVGSSRLLFAIDAPYVQTRLSQRLGRPATVVTLGWEFSGYDTAYQVVHDLLSRRRVRAIVIYDEYNGYPGRPYPDNPSVGASYLFRWGDDPAALTGLPAYDQLRLYAAAVWQGPRRLLKPLHPDATFTLEGRGRDLLAAEMQGGDLVAQLGSVRARLGYGWNREFVPRARRAVPSGAAAYPGTTGSPFTFTGPPAPPYERHFARRLAELCQAHGVRLLMLHPPTYAECASSRVLERGVPEDLFGRPVPLLGIPGERLFAGVPAAELPQYFVDEVHLNQNGQDLFTPAITPILLQLYEAHGPDL